MSSSIQYDDHDATRVFGQRPAALAAAAPLPDASLAELQAFAGLNPLVACASGLLAALATIRASITHPDPAGLRPKLLQQIQQFESGARSRGVAAETVLIARYALATMADETVAGTPWGGTAEWVRNSLLVTLHKETWGGEKFFHLLNRLAEDPARNIDLLELLYVCLCLGFAGRYRVVDNGAAQLDALRERVAGIIRPVRGSYERELSPAWRGEHAPIGKHNRFLMLWPAAAGTALLLLCGYLWLSFSLNEVSDSLAFGKVQVKMPAYVPQPVPPAQPLLRRFLAPEIEEGLVEVIETAGESRVLLRGSDLFESGSASIAPAFEPSLARIAAALNAVAGSVTITGHTDDLPIRSARFPSNWQLSQERARSVLRHMAPMLKDPRRLSAEGRADQEPLVPNDSSVHRARNRRVEITLRTGGA
ncbi:type IVB secretion system protein IcmH/DotU [Massilia horti]|uniref:Type VI secretion system protein TssL n=1 Tax=Massilia horti TaxID=2562153 RepID=A0A4Y9SM37_9BURK|nr:type IVB secretion system protein IcmH/DotU [Massilia horti]TFW27720.1 type VI secretion system protein TssL [Massilia horti]